jgi:peptide/nickel transport system permease protein
MTVMRGADPEDVARAAAETELAPAPGLFRRIVRQRVAVLSAFVLAVIILVAVFAPVLAPYDPNQQNLLQVLQSPSAEHWLGTDTFGRDNLSRLIFGARVSLAAGGLALVVALVLGGSLGLIAGASRGGLNKFLGGVNDALLSVPALVLCLAVVASVGPGIGSAMFAVGIVMSPRFFRLSETAAASLSQELYVKASYVIGCTRSRTAIRHILPNALPPVIVEISFVLGSAIAAEAGLSFLGLGVRPPTASWGSMLAEAASRLDKPYLIWGPAAALSLTVLAFASLGDAVRDALGPRKRG